MTKRISYIDNTRAILIALVVLGHILNYANPKYDIVPYVLVQQFLDSFHMPAFFVLSGMLTNGDKWRGRSVGSYFLHKAKTLLVPYLFFECVAILYKHFVLRSVSIAEGLRLMLTFRCNIGNLPPEIDARFIAAVDADFPLQHRRGLVFAGNVCGVCAVLFIYTFSQKTCVGNRRRFALHRTSVYAGRTCSDIDLPRCTRLCVYAGGQSAE